MSTQPAALRRAPGRRRAPRLPLHSPPPVHRWSLPSSTPPGSVRGGTPNGAGTRRGAPAKMAAAQRGPDGTGPGTSRRAPWLTAPRSVGPLASAEGGGGWRCATPSRAESRKCTSTWWGGGHRAVRGWGGRVSQWSWPPVPVHVACAASETDPRVGDPVPVCFRELLCRLTRLDSAGSRL